MSDNKASFNFNIGNGQIENVDEFIARTAKALAEGDCAKRECELMKARIAELEREIEGVYSERDQYRVNMVTTHEKNKTLEAELAALRSANRWRPASEPPTPEEK